jgi:hypothetical protein
MGNPQDKDDTKAPGHHGNQGQEGARPSGQDRQEQYQRTKDQTPSEPDASNNLSRGTPGDREDRIRQRAHEIWEREGRPDNQAQEHWDRAAQDLDREDAEIQREGAAGEKPGVRTGPEPDSRKSRSDRT